MFELKKEDLRDKLKDSHVIFYTDEELDKIRAERYNEAALHQIGEDLRKISVVENYLEKIACNTGVDISHIKVLYKQLIKNPYSALENMVTTDHDKEITMYKQWYKDGRKENRALKSENKRLQEELRSK